MARFMLGVVLGAVVALGYVRLGDRFPSWLQLPEMLRGNLVSTAVEQDLYDLEAEPLRRSRALEVYLANRARDAAEADAAAGHPLLSALHRRRAVSQARQLLAKWRAFDEVLAQPALRAALERKHAVASTDRLKLQMLREELDGAPFLKAWLARNGGDPAMVDLPARLAVLTAGRS